MPQIGSKLHWVPHPAWYSGNLGLVGGELVSGVGPPSLVFPALTTHRSKGLVMKAAMAKDNHQTHSIIASPKGLARWLGIEALLP